MYWPLKTFDVKLRPATVTRAGACVNVYCSTPLRLLRMSGSGMSGPRPSSSPQDSSSKDADRCRGHQADPPRKLIEFIM